MQEQLSPRQRQTLSNMIPRLQKQNEETRAKIAHHRANPKLTENQRSGMIRMMQRNIAEREEVIASIRARLDSRQAMAA
jgi:hypothetical protein